MFQNPDLSVRVRCRTVFFFFSSRRRHTRFDCDWSSDVCSSDLGLARSYAALFAARAAVGIGEAAYGTISPALLADYYPRERRGRVFAIFFAAIQIGRASCRERG